MSGERQKSTRKKKNTVGDLPTNSFSTKSKSAKRVSELEERMQEEVRQRWLKHLEGCLKEVVPAEDRVAEQGTIAEPEGPWPPCFREAFLDVLLSNMKDVPEDGGVRKHVPEDSFHRLQKWMSGEEPELNRTKEGTVMVDMAGFLLEKLKAAERQSLEGSVTMRARDQGLFDVLMTKEEHNSESFTRLHVVLVPGDRCIEDGQSPYRIGYVYYVQAQRDKELAEEFDKHLPSFRQTFVEPFPLPNGKVIYRINALFADGSFPEASETLAAKFFAAFCRILEDKS